MSRHGEARHLRLALAAATLGNDLIGIVLPGGGVLLYSLWQRDWALWRHLHLGKGLALFLDPDLALVRRRQPR